MDTVSVNCQYTEFLKNQFTDIYYFTMTEIPFLP